MKTAALFVGSIAVIGAGWFAIGSLKSTAYASTVSFEPVVHPVFDPSRIDREIGFHEGRVRRDPTGALGWSMLSAAYLAKSREFDSDASAWNAEEAASKSLALRRTNNASAAKRLVSSLLEQHRFQDALKAVEDGLRIDPSDISFTKLKIDILIEIGQVEQANRLLGGLDRNDPSTPTLQARILSAGGRHAEAAAKLETAYATLVANRDVLPEDLAWYRVKIGNEWLAAGDLSRADREFSEALTLHPRNYKARLSMTKLALARKDFSGAIVWGKSVLEVADSMEAKALIANAELASGDMTGFKDWKDKIVDQYRSEDRKFEALHRGGPLHARPEDRMFATFCAENRMPLREAMVAAKRDLANRPDEQARENLAVLRQLSKAR